ncbi:MAG: beta-lactamase family protein [Ruminococcaceae bacterium]|nr:beta-lactamase family protein [Oscillospiraceae bacterium]
MKRVFAIVLSLALLLTGCAADTPEPENTTVTTTAPAPAEPEPVVVVTDEVKAALDAVLEKHKYEGIVYLTHNGQPVYQWVSGTNDMGQPLTMDSPMYIGSISKQFCAAAILMLRDQGKLSLDDTLEKYFPEYTIGKDITLHNLLSMRSGIVQDAMLLAENTDMYAQMPAEELNSIVLDWIFSQPLRFEQGAKHDYSNVNYMLLSYVVEQASGQSYEEFIQQNICEPLGMPHTGFRNSVMEHPEWGLTCEKVNFALTLGDVAQGCGDLISTAGDMDIWMTALKSGKVVCEESYQQMTTDYSPDKNNPYGYGLMPDIRNGWGHGGADAYYTSGMYFNREYGYNFYIVTNNSPVITSGGLIFPTGRTDKVSTELLRILFTATDAANK